MASKERGENLKSTLLRQMLTAIALLTAISFIFEKSLANPIGGPSVWIESPQNKVYNSDVIELDFIIPPEPFWMESSYYTALGYYLDGGSEVAVNGNTTLTGLSLGVHSLVVYAETVDGEAWLSPIVYFSIFPTWFVITVITVTGVGLSLLFYSLYRIGNRRKQFQK